MSTLEPYELLEKGAAYIEEHGLWQGRFWPGTGEWEDALTSGHPACLSGALQIAAMGDEGSYATARVSLIWHLGESPIDWNDKPGRTAAEVADAMRACATNLRGAS